MRVAFLVALTLIAVAPTAEAQRQCRRGKPCGRTCIARDKVCRIETPGVIAPDANPERPLSRPRRSRAGTLPTPIGATVPCNIVRVVDGDTVHCAGGARVRLLLIDAPESDQRPYGAIATRALRQIVPVGTHTTLELDVQHRDRYGRLLAYIYAPDGRMANEEMVREGYALLYTVPPNVRHVDRMRTALEEAKAERRGLWATPAFECPPVLHRRRAC